VATTAVDAGVALVAGAASATAGAIVIVRSTLRADEASGRLAEIRTIAVVAAALLLAALTVLRPAWNAASDGPVFVVAFLSLGIALAVRSGAVPFHVACSAVGPRRSAARARAAPRLDTGRRWAPGDQLERDDVGTRSDWLNAAVGSCRRSRWRTLVLGSLAALVHDELEEVAATRSWPIRASCCSPWLAQ